jgi:hexokinase
VIQIINGPIVIDFVRVRFLALAVIVNRINKPMCTVGVDGSLYRYHPRFKRNMEKCMATLVNKNIKVNERTKT